MVLRLELPERSIYEVDDISFETLFNFFPRVPQGKRAYASWLEYSARHGDSQYKQTVHPDCKALVDTTPDGKDALIMWHGMDEFRLDFRGLEVADTYTQDTKPISTIYICIRESVEKLCAKVDQRGNNLMRNCADELAKITSMTRLYSLLQLAYSSLNPAVEASEALVLSRFQQFAVRAGPWSLVFSRVLNHLSGSIFSTYHIQFHLLASLISLTASSEGR